MAYSIRKGISLKWAISSGKCVCAVVGRVEMGHCLLKEVSQLFKLSLSLGNPSKSESGCTLQNHSVERALGNLLISCP